MTNGALGEGRRGRKDVSPAQSWAAGWILVPLTLTLYANHKGKSHDVGGKRTTLILVTEPEVSKRHPGRHSEAIHLPLTDALLLRSFRSSLCPLLASVLPSWNIQSSGTETLERHMWHAVECSKDDLRSQRSADKHNSMKPDNLGSQGDCAYIHTSQFVSVRMFYGAPKNTYKELHITVGNHGNKQKTSLDFKKSKAFAILTEPLIQGRIAPRIQVDRKRLHSI